MKARLLTALVVTLLAVPLMAQDTEVTRLRDAAQDAAFGARPAESPFSLLDFSRMHWSHSYSISFISGQYGSGSVGMLNSTMLYEFSSKLTLTLNLGVLHNAGSMWGDGSTNGELLPSFRLDWRPSNKFHMSIGVSQYDGRVSPYYYPGASYPYRNWLFPY